MPTVAYGKPDPDIPEFMTWNELEKLPDEVAGEIELWDGRVIWNRRPPTEHQVYAVRMMIALESAARLAMQDQSEDAAEPPCWKVAVETNIFFTPDKSSYLTPDFLVRRCLPPGADTTAADVVLVGEVLSRSDTRTRREWKREQYAEAGIPWYWEVDVDTRASWQVSAVRAYELVQAQTAGLTVKLLRPAMYYGLAGEWQAGDADIEFPAPFPLRITWDDLVF